MKIVDDLLKMCKDGDKNACVFLFENAVDIDKTVFNGSANLHEVKDDIFYDRNSLIKGMLVELEHTNNPLKAVQIAKHHLEERDDYYTVHENAGL